MILALVSYDLGDIAVLQTPPNDPPLNFIGPVGAWFGFVAPPVDMLAGMGALVLGYLVCAQWLKADALADRSSPLAPRH